MASLLDKAYERKRNQTQSAVSDLSLLERARSRKAGSTQSDVEDRIQTFLKNHDTFIGNYTRRARTANPGSDLDSWQDAVESQRNAFRKEGQQLLSLLEQNSAGYDPDWVASSKQALNDALGHQAGALQYIGGLQKEANRQRAQRAAPEAVGKTLEQLPKVAHAVKNAVHTSMTGDRLPSMDDYMRMYGYHNTYGGKSYQELMDAASAMEDGEEKDWILSYAPSVMTSEDYQSRIDRNEELIPILERYQQLTQVRQNDAVRKAYGISGSVDEEEFLAEAERMAKTAGYTSAEEAAADLENLRKENWEYEGMLKFGSIRNNEDYDQLSAVPSASREELEAVAKMRNAIIQGEPEKTQAMQRQAEAAARHLGYTSAEQAEMALRAMDRGLPANGNEKYSYINDIGGYRDISKSMFGDTGPGNKERSGPGTGPYAVYDAMTPEEIADYNYIYNTMGEKDAEEYLERLEYTLNQRRMDEALGEAERMAIFNPGMAFVKSVAGNMVGGAGAVDVATQNARRTLTGEYRPVDYNRSAMMPTMESALIRGSQTRQINNQFGTIQLDPEEHPYLSRLLNGKGWGDAYQLGASLIDSAAVAALSPVVGSWGTALLGSNAAAQSMVETAQRGGTDQQALAMGLLAGGAEMLFEKYELDQLLGQSDKWLRSVVNQALSEGVGEGATSIANTLTDILIMADKSQLAELTAEYEASGMSHSDARKEAFLDIAAQIGTDALGGFLTGSIMGGSAAILNKIGGNNQTSAQEAPEETVPPYMEPTTVQAQAPEAQEAEPAPAIPQKQLSEEELQAIPNRMDAAANATDPFAAYGEKAESAEQIPQEQVPEKEKKEEPSRKKIKAPKEGFQVSGSGKTVVSGENGEINIKRIGEPVNGEMVLELEDGRKIRASEVEFADDGLATVYEMAASLNTDAETANLVIDTWLKEPGGVSAEDFALGAAEVFWNGAHNLDITDNRYGARLTKLQRSNTYFLGKRYGQLDVASAQTAAMRRRMAQRFSEKEKGGWLKYDGDWDSLTEAERTNLNVIETVAKTLGMRFHVYESQVDEQGRYVDENGESNNGWYDPKDGTIHIDLYAGADGRGTMLFTAAHEMTHFIKDWSAEKFKVLADFLMEQYRSKGQSVNDLIDAQILKAEGNNRSIDRDTAFEEVIADSMESMLADGSILEKLEALKVKDRTLWEKIRDHIRELAAKIREIYQNLKPDSREGQYVAQWDKEFTRLQEMFLEGAVEAGKNYQRSVLRPDEEGTVVNENGEPVADSVGDGTVRLSMRTYEEDGRKVFRQYLQSCVSSNRLTQAEMQEMLDGIEEIYGICKEFKDKYAPFSTWSDAAVVRDTYGKPVFSVVTPNGDYKMNLDFSLVCKKRRTLDAVFNEMSKRGIIDDFELGQKSVVKINEIIRKHGFETACALCFVDAKRFRQASMADSFTSLYNELVLSLVPEKQKGSIDHFNFSGYATIKKVEDGIHKWDASKLDFSHLDEVMKNYGSGTVEHKAAKYIKSHAEGRRLLLRGDFMSSQGFDAVKTQNKDILKLYNSKKGTGGPKAAFGDVQYMNEIIKKARTWTPAKAYAVGGIRIQSFSDYVPRMVFDYAQMIYDLAATKLPAHAYTKEALFAKQFGLTGVKINMSLIPAIAEGGVAPGLDANGNYVWAGESFDFETAKQIQNADGYTENCGTICVGVSDRHIRKLLSDPEIRMVIPYHKSGLNPIVAHMNRIADFTDYTNDQRTKGADGKALSKDFDFSKALHQMGKNANPKAAADAYLKWCSDNGYTPRFQQFARRENYYKLLEDFTLLDKDGNYVPQREVRAVFPAEDSAFGSMKDLIQEGLQEDAVIDGRRDKELSTIVDEIQNTLPRTDAEIPETEVAQADRDLEAEAISKEDVRYSDRDYSYDSLVSKSDMVVTTVNGAVPNNRADVVAVAKKNAAKVGKFDPKTGSVSVHVKDIDSDVVIGRDGLKHSIDRRLNVNAPVVLKAGEIIINSIRINELTPKKEGADESYVLIGVARNAENELYVVRSVVNRFTNELASMDVLYAINAKKESAALLPLSTEKPALGTDSSISIAKLLDYVNQYFPDILPEGVLKHYGYDARPEGILGESALYQSRSDEAVSFRREMANYFEGLAQDDEERKLLAEYQAKVNELDADFKRMRQLREQIREMTFGKGPRDQEQLNALRKEAEKLARHVGAADRELLKLEAAEPMKLVMQRVEKNAVNRTNKKRKQDLEDYRERTVAKEVKGKIRRRLQELNKLMRAEDKKTVKEDMRGLVETAIDLADRLFTDNITDEDLILGQIDQEDIRESDRAHLEKARQILQELDKLGYDPKVMDQREKLKRQLSTEKGKIRELLLQQRNRLNAKEIDPVLNDLEKLYKRTLDSAIPGVKAQYDDAIIRDIQMLREEWQGVKVKNMTAQQLQELHDLYKSILTSVRKANKFFLSEKNRGVAEIGMETIQQIQEAKKPVGKLSDTGIAKEIRMASWNNEKPMNALERIGSDHMINLFGKFLDGQKVAYQDLREGRDFKAACEEKYGVKKWDTKKAFTFTDDMGQSFRMSLEQMLSLYAYSRRDQALDHLKKGGFIFDSSVAYVPDPEAGAQKLKQLTAKSMKWVVNRQETHRLNQKTLKQISDALTAEQKAYVREMQSYLSDVMGEKGNEVSMEMYGIRKFNERNYFPLKSANQFLFEENHPAGESKMKNSGFTKKAVPKANNPIILKDFSQVWSDHVAEMANYHGFVLPIEDFNKLLNFNYNNTFAVKSALMASWGNSAERYLKQFLTDLNGGAVKDPRESAMSSLVSKTKRASVTLSLSVSIQQPPALYRAMAIVDPKHFAKVDKKLPKKWFVTNWQEALQYSGAAGMKEIGGYDVGMGRGASDWVRDDQSGIVKAYETVTGFAPEWLDKWAWSQIWHACKREQASAHPNMKTSDPEFLTLVGKRFDDVITRTQVYDSTLTRSGFMRSKSGLVQMATAFMAEPTTNINMLEHGIRSIRKGKKGEGARYLAAVYGSAILNAAFASVVYALRDRDEDETFWEKYLEALTSKLVEAVDPTASLPLLRDIRSLLLGYDVNRMDMSLLAALSTDLISIVKLASQDTYQMSEEELKQRDEKLKEAWIDATLSFGNLFGVSAKNLRRDILAIGNLIDLAGSDLQSTGTSLINAAVSGLKNSIPLLKYTEGDSKSDRIYKAILNEDQETLKRLTDSLQTEEAANSAVIRGLKENDRRIEEAARARLEGNHSLALKLKNEILEEGLFTENQIVKAITARYNDLKPDEESTSAEKAKALGSAAEFAAAIAEGRTEDGEAVRSELVRASVENGASQSKAEKAFQSSAKNELLELYKSDAITHSSLEKALKTYCGLDAEEAAAAIRQAECVKDTGTEYTDIKSAYIAGEIDRDTASRMRMDYGGYSLEEAEADVGKWTVERNSGGDYTYSDIDDLYKDGELSAGEVKQMYMDYGDLDEEQAEQKVAVLDFVKEHPECDGIGYTAVEAYKALKEKIDAEVWYDGWKYKSAARSDRDADGNILKAASEKVFEYIDGLSLTGSQKRAMALGMYSESTVRDSGFWRRWK